jgi:hypothetical protein
VLGLVQLAIPLTIGDPDDKSLGTSVNLKVPGVVEFSSPVGATLGGASLLHAPVGVKLEIPLLYALQLPLPRS